MLYGPGQRIIQIKPLGNIANRMLQYMAAIRLHDLVPGSVITNIELATWGIEVPPYDWSPKDSTYLVTRTNDYDVIRLSRLLRSGEVSGVIIDDFVQRMDFFPSLSRCRTLFQPSLDEISDLPTFSPEEILINVRAGEILDGVHHYPLIPIQFYEDLVQRTGLKPVIMGQLEPSFYLEALARAFPTARYLESQGPLRDFTMIRSAHHIIASVSTFSWLAAWLSSAQTIHLALVGFTVHHCFEI